MHFTPYHPLAIRDIRLHFFCRWLREFNSNDINK